MKPKIKNKDYQLLFEGNRKVYSKYYVFYYRPFERMVVKTAVKKRVGKAVLRSFHKRRLREILSQLVKSQPNKKLLILAIVIRKPELSYIDEFQYVERNLKPILD